MRINRRRWQRAKTNAPQRCDLSGAHRGEMAERFKAIDLGSIGATLQGLPRVRIPLSPALFYTIALGWSPAFAGRLLGDPFALLR